MRIQLGSLLAGGLLVAAGFALAQAPSWLREADAGIVANRENQVVTSNEQNPGVLYTWTLTGHQVTSVTQHMEQPDGVVVSRELKLYTAPRVR